MALLTTPLTECHYRLAAKMAGFAGYDMPIQYADGIMKEHEWVRSAAGVFDVSHMGQLLLKGVGAGELLEKLTPSSILSLPVGKCKYTVLITEQGGVIDDLIITRLGEESWYLVVNASRKEVDEAWISKHLLGDMTLERFTDRALIALQGPQAASVLAPFVATDLSQLGYMHAVAAALKDGTQVLISRTGYTGEDGFEISLPGSCAARLWDDMLADARVRPIGLGARDSLRLEMGYPLYGHDLSEEISPVEAGIGWILAKNRHDYYGGDVIRQQQEVGAKRRRIGLVLKDRGVVRENVLLYLSAEAKEGESHVGVTCSGGFSPSLQQSIAMAYVDVAKAGNAPLLYAEVRGKRLAAQVASMPFYQPKKRAAA